MALVCAHRESGSLAVLRKNLDGDHYTVMLKGAAVGGLGLLRKYLQAVMEYYVKTYTSNNKSREDGWQRTKGHC